MKRENLKELGLDDKQVEAVMKANGQDIQATKDKFGDVYSLKASNESLTKQLAERDKDLTGLKKKVKDNEDLSSQLTELQGKYKTDTDNLNSKLSQVKLDSSLNSALNKANARNPQAVRGLLNMDSIKLDDKGNLEGLDDQLKNLHETDAYLFNEGNRSNYKPGGNGVSSDDISAAEQFKAAWGVKKE